MVGKERTGGGRWVNIFLPGHSFTKHRSDAVTCLLKTPSLSFSHRVNEAQNALTGPTGHLTVLLQLTLLLLAESFNSPSFHPPLWPIRIAWLPLFLLVWSSFLPTFTCQPPPLPLKPFSFEKLDEGRSCALFNCSPSILRGFFLPIVLQVLSHLFHLCLLPGTHFLRKSFFFF